MFDRPFHALTRQSSAASRRVSLKALGTEGLGAFSTAQVTTDAKNSKQRKRCKKDKKACKNDLADCTAAGAQCVPQVEQCTIFLTALCAGDPGCQDSIACCQLNGSCDANAFLECLFFQS